MANSKIITVKRIQINLGGKLIDAYSAGEPHPTLSDSFINYLSGAGMARVIGMCGNAAALKRLPAMLKDMLGKDFETKDAVFKNSKGALSKIKLWRIEDAQKFFSYHALKGNKKATSIVYPTIKERPKITKTTPGKLYLITNASGTYLKIGYSTSPKRRLRGLQTANPEKLELLATRNGTLQDEAILHSKFKDLAACGEWFHYSQHIVDEFC